MTTRRRRLAVVVPAVLFALLWPSAASAADEIGLSNDGRTWGPELSLPLFDADRRWVPGDEETHTFHVRNEGPSAAAMTVAALSPSGDPVLAADVSLSVRLDGGAWRPLDVGANPGQVTLDGVAVDRAVPVDVRAAFDPASGNDTQNRLMPVVLRVTLVGDVPTDAGTGDDGAGSPGDPGGGPSLPDTGSTLGPELLLVGLALGAAGTFLITRRSSDDDLLDGVTR
ncbi:LPXTG cell wall anchor domain-containing protein [Ruania suaedae]|uniref:LPXTG cell wall anchor domain-containing protein n=1 Tax=Ruania suaedae TaxID=2897774 RepID=UPI001E2BDAF3|nr:LPXTG cell wall anchor domain-containing protein [Ruania suaedae]UFU01713.1 LPXTG cell wall anchor domain-containing protein [Ruania suaedae]